jgi:ketosteroid isomerase-like protein/mono/diheme cytochrome c family protein
MPFITRRSLLILALGLVALLFAAGLFVGSGVYNVGADATHTRPVYSLLQAARERSIAHHARSLAVPPLADAALIRSGAGNYEAMCTGCHLAPGRGATELSKGLYPAPPNLSQRKPDDPAHDFWVIKHGIKASGMPAWGKSMDDRSIWGMVAFLQKMPTLDARAYQALVASSGGHSHGGGEGDEEHDAGEAHHHDDESAHHDEATMGGTLPMPGTAQPTPPHATVDAKAIPAEARPAVEVVERFTAALKAGNLPQAGALLAPDALILESGGAERSREHYLADHARADAAFLKDAKIQLLHRTARVQGHLAWVGSESELHTTGKQGPVTLLSTETMVLKRTPQGWRIVHIHWSSQAKGAQG